MIFTTKAGYGLRAMVQLAKNYSREPYSLNKISRLEGISLAYLERLMAALKKKGLVESVKGAKGGYILAKTPAKVTVFEIVEALTIQAYQVLAFGITEVGEFASPGGYQAGYGMICAASQIRGHSAPFGADGREIDLYISVCLSGRTRAEPARVWPERVTVGWSGRWRRSPSTPRRVRADLLLGHNAPGYLQNPATTTLPAILPAT